MQRDIMYRANYCDSISRKIYDLATYFIEFLMCYVAV